MIDKRKQQRYKRIYSLLRQALLLGAFGFLSLGLYLIALQNPIEKDFTQMKVHTLSESTVSLLEEMHKPLFLTLYSADKETIYSLKILAKRLARFADVKLLIRSEELPKGLEERFGRARDMLHIRFSGAEEWISVHQQYVTEAMIANSLMRMKEANERWVLMLPMSAQDSPRDLIQLSQSLGRSGAHVATQSFAHFHIADNMKIVLLPNAQAAFQQKNHMEALLNWVRSGGVLFALLSNLDLKTQTLLNQYGIHAFLATQEDGVRVSFEELGLVTQAPQAYLEKAVGQGKFIVVDAALASESLGSGALQNMIVSEMRSAETTVSSEERQVINLPSLTSFTWFYVDWIAVICAPILLAAIGWAHSRRSQ